jgi:dolichol-phosphate mannosyltransferase
MSQVFTGERAVKGNPSTDTDKSRMKRILVFTATLNEAGNIGRLISDIFCIAPQADILVIDDNSSDGTGKILDKLANANPKLSVIHRHGKLGLGTAHLHAMEYAVKNNYEALVTLDADYSHDPKYLPQMLTLLEKHDFVIGSRYVERPTFSLELSYQSNCKNVRLLIVVSEKIS